jgi:RNA polymerase sigma-70 factor (ECF subfamily)
MNRPDHSEHYTLTDAALVEMLQMDHEWALREIFNRHNLRLFRLAVGVLKDEALAKDIVQDIFIDLWNRRRSSQIQILANYLTRAAKFQILKTIRKQATHDQYISAIENIRFVNETEEAIDLQELDNALQKAVGELSPRCQEVFMLSRFEHLSHKEIASRMNISSKTVEIQIGKALAFLRQRLHRFFFFCCLFIVL